MSQISDEQRDAAPGDEVAAHVHGVCPLPMGMERDEGQVWVNGSTDLQGVHGSTSALNLE